MIQYYLETTSNAPLSSAYTSKAKETSPNSIIRFLLLGQWVINQVFTQIDICHMQTVKESSILKQATRATRSLREVSLQDIPKPGHTKGRQGNTPLLKSWHSQRFVLRNSLPGTFCHLCTQAQKKSVLKQHHSNTERFTWDVWSACACSAKDWLTWPEALISSVPAYQLLSLLPPVQHS